MTSKYNEQNTIESLKEIFYKYALKSELNHSKQIEEFQKNYPDDQLPEHLRVPSFNLPCALFVICAEIVKLKEENERRVR